MPSLHQQRHDLVETLALRLRQHGDHERGAGQTAAGENVHAAVHAQHQRQQREPLDHDEGERPQRRDADGRADGANLRMMCDLVTIDGIIKMTTKSPIQT